MKIFPHSLLRIAGSSYDELEQLDINDSLLSSYLIKKNELVSLKKRIDDELYNLIGSLNNRSEQNILLNLKRDIYNDRNIQDEHLEQVFKITNDSLKKLIQLYLTLSCELEVTKRDCEKEFLHEEKKCRKLFRKLIQENNFNKGLLLSSKSLRKGIESYLSKESQEFSRNDYKAEQGALKYLTRFRTKTSPFSTFTNLSVLRHKKCPDYIAFEKDQRSINSHVRLNNYLFKYLTDVILKNPEVYIHFHLRLNPTLRKEKEAFVYLTNSNNVESFQRIEVNPLLTLLTEKLSEKKEGLIFGNVIKILTEYVDAGQEDLRHYIYELVQYGFIEFNLGVSGIDTEWDVKLRSKLKRLEEAGVPLIAELRSTLKELRELAQKYEKADVSKRGKILAKAFEEFKSIALELHEEAGLPEEERMSLKERRVYRKRQRRKNEEQKADKDSAEQNDEALFKHKSNTFFHFKPKNIFYEDTTLDIPGAIDKESLSNFVEHLNTLLSLLSFSKGKLSEKDKMVHFFRENYTGLNNIDLFSFYEDYYRKVKKPEAEYKKRRMQKKENAEEDNKNWSSDIKKVKEREDLIDEWVSLFKQTLEESSAETNATKINISQKQIKNINNKLNISSSLDARNSLGAFLQFFIDEKNGEPTLKGVINSTTGGFGKMLSRFLHLFDDQVKNDLKRWNTSLVEKELLLENTDASYFNANLHPPLMPYEIWIPGGHNSLGEEKQVPITDLSVKLSDKQDDLELIYEPEGIRVYIFDLGFQGIKGRSQLFQMLSNFTLMDYLFYHPVLNAVTKWVNQGCYTDESHKEENKEDDIILEYPRIEYENTIVLQRKSWSIPRSLLPGKDEHESRWEYYIKVNEWRKEHNIPKEVFVFVMPRHQRAKISRKKRQKLSGDDYKPQYINFSNPILVDLFAKLARKVPISMRIEEMLPGSNQLFKIGDKRFVTECIVQWYNFNKN